MNRELFAYPETVRFECTRCGDCCRTLQIGLGRGEREELDTLDWRGRADDLVDQTLIEKIGSRWTLRRRADGACVFLGDENQCLIHEHFGAERKPLMCRLFPFGFSRIGDLVAVDVSFACRSISEASGAPLKKRVPEWAGLLGEAPDEGSKQHPFSNKYEVSGELLWELEHDLLELLTDRSLTFVDRARTVWEFMRLGTTSDPTTAAARTLRRVMAEGIPKQIRERPTEGTMDKTQRAVFFHLLFLSLNPTPPELLRTSGKLRHEQVRQRVQKADAYKFPDAHPWVDNRELRRSFREIAAIGDDFVRSDAANALLERYLAAKVLGQRFLREGDGELSFVEAVPRLLLLYPMAIWTAKALAAELGETEIREKNLRGAIRLLDRSYGQVRLSDLPAKQKKAWRFILMETELPLCATLDMLRA